MSDPQLINERRKFQIDEAILILLLMLSLVGVAVTDFNPDDGYGYWLFMVLVFAVFAIVIAWLQSKNRMEDFAEIVWDQAKHWGTSLIVVAGTFLLQKSGQLNQTSASLVVLLILSLAIMLDGLRIGWHFSLLGLFINTAAIVMAFFDNFMWILILLALVIVASTLFWEIRQYRRGKR